MFDIFSSSKYFTSLIWVSTFLQILSNLLLTPRIPSQALQSLYTNTNRNKCENIIKFFNSHTEKCQKKLVWGQHCSAHSWCHHLTWKEHLWHLLLWFWSYFLLTHLGYCHLCSRRKTTHGSLLQNTQPQMLWPCGKSTSRHKLAVTLPFKWISLKKICRARDKCVI